MFWVWKEWSIISSSGVVNVLLLIRQSVLYYNHGQNSWDTLVFSYTEVHKGNKTPNYPPSPPPHPNHVDSVMPKCSLQISTLVGGGGGEASNLFPNVCLSKVMALPCLNVQCPKVFWPGF